MCHVLSVKVKVAPITSLEYRLTRMASFCILRALEEPTKVRVGRKAERIERKKMDELILEMENEFGNELYGSEPLGHCDSSSIMQTEHGCEQ